LVALSEFELIQAYFTDLDGPRDDVVLGVGDDCALVRTPPGMQLALSIDTLVEGIHFFPDVDPESLGHKALAVNLSDLAAMGATPAWATLALTLPHADPPWLAAFSRGFAALAKRYEVQLIGGDTTRGPLTVTIQAHGWLPAGQALCRAGARVGDLIYVTGTLGDAGLALHQRLAGRPWQAVAPALRLRLERPEPRIETGLVLREIASAAIDLSDGLLADLDHILRASGCGAQVRLDRIPLSDPVAEAVETGAGWQLPLSSGDDYELCFTLPPAHQHRLARLSERLSLPITRIGEIETGSGLRCVQADGNLWRPDQPGYEHFPVDDQA
jgi:thiamine-monophosphate kinase